MTIASKSELDARRFLPCRPVLAVSPNARSPGREVCP